MLAALVIGPLVLLAGCLTILFSWRHRANSNSKRRSQFQVAPVSGVRRVSYADLLQHTWAR